MKAVQVDTDWTKSGDDFMKEYDFEMKPCTVEDFGTDETAAGYFYSWNGFILMCPELTNKDGKNLTLDGAWGFNQTSRIEFRVDLCNKAEDDTCAEANEVNAMLRDMKIQSWILHDHIDFRNHTHRPTTQQM